MSKIAAMFAQLCHTARATRRDARAGLGKGARLSVRVVPLEGGREEITLTIARLGKVVGDGELVTFRQHCGVPLEAQRWPSNGAQHEIKEAGEVWRAVAFRWATPPAHGPVEAAPVAQEEAAL